MLSVAYIMKILFFLNFERKMVPFSIEITDFLAETFKNIVLDTPELFAVIANNTLHSIHHLLRAMFQTLEGNIINEIGACPHSVP